MNGAQQGARSLLVTSLTPFARTVGHALVLMELFLWNPYMENTLRWSASLQTAPFIPPKALQVRTGSFIDLIRAPVHREEGNCRTERAGGFHPEGFITSPVFG